MGNLSGGFGSLVSGKQLSDMMENRTHFETQCNLSLSVSVTHKYTQMYAHTLTRPNDFTHTHTNTHTLTHTYPQLLHSEDGFIHVLLPNLVGKC